MLGDPTKVVNIAKAVNDGTFNVGLIQLTDIGRIDNQLTGTINVQGDPTKVVNIARTFNSGTLNTGLIMLI